MINPIGTPGRWVQANPGVPLVRAVSCAVALLKSFTSGPPKLTLAELAQIAKLDKGTTRRLLHTLSEAGLGHFGAST
jgi:hypothetical protein